MWLWAKSYMPCPVKGPNFVTRLLLGILFILAIREASLCSLAMVVMGKDAGLCADAWETTGLFMPLRIRVRERLPL